MILGICEKNCAWKRCRSVVGCTLQLQNGRDHIVDLYILERWDLPSLCKLRSVRNKNGPHREECIVVAMRAAALAALGRLQLHLVAFFQQSNNGWNSVTLRIMKPPRQILFQAGELRAEELWTPSSLEEF